MLLIFDCDGVLRSISWNALINAYIAIIKDFGMDWQDFFSDIEEFKKWWNVDWHKNAEKLGITNDKMQNSAFHKYYDPEIYIFKWVENTVKQLDKRHYLAILSASTESSIRRFLGRKIIKYFPIIVGQEQVSKLKPDPEGINLILSKTGFQQSEVLMIGDMPEDILAGKNAGVKTAGVLWGLGEKEELLKANPDYLYEKPSDLFFI